MIDKFINRKNEMKVLEERFNSDKPEFIVIYGRRRVGKTELIKNFSK
ncbi:MAG: ATP-binding protein, partial [Candidatus Bathyarchaeia archaeon]